MAPLIPLAVSAALASLRNRISGRVSSDSKPVIVSMIVGLAVVGFAIGMTIRDHRIAREAVELAAAKGKAVEQEAVAKAWAEAADRAMRTAEENARHAELSAESAQSLETELSDVRTNLGNGTAVVVHPSDPWLHVRRSNR